jgi:hypothetical protein
MHIISCVTSLFPRACPDGRLCLSVSITTRMTEAQFFIASRTLVNRMFPFLHDQTLVDRVVISRKSSATRLASMR